ncbi:MAG TPA: tetratricopeptide repeat protein [Vicinamibacterales bacterium]|jgi:TPR repeat protein|nr:tetratricopeptide repeat protein [Vicinamibacterales bacterium]
MIAAVLLVALASAAPAPRDLYLQALDYYSGQNGLQTDRLKAGELFLEAANGGDPDAEYTVGRMYQNGLAGVQRDAAQARFWYERGASHGQLEAMRNLASLYEGGSGGPQDFKRALEYFRRAAERGHARSLYEISYMTEHGYGVKPNPGDAYMWRLLSVRLAPDDEVGEYRKGLAILDRSVEGAVRRDAAKRADSWLRSHKLAARNEP